MKAVGYYIILPLLYLLMLVPFPVFYLLSDLVFLLLFYVVGYRKKIVLQNLQRSFPEKSMAEIKGIRRRFYRYLCDLFMETFKGLTITRKNVLRHCKMNAQALALFEKYAQEKKSIIVVMGHYGNWEWAGNTFSMECPQQLYVIYHPLSNKYFDGLMYKLRTRFGTKLYAMNDTFKEMVKHRNEINATAFIADQTPAPESAYWTRFLNQDTPVFWGTEKIARKMNYPVVYVSVKRPKRGRYEIFAETLVENPKDTPEGEISEAHTRRLERDICENPEIWLWSHRRWKHHRPAEKAHL